MRQTDELPRIVHLTRAQREARGPLPPPDWRIKLPHLREREVRETLKYMDTTADRSLKFLVALPLYRSVVALAQEDGLSIPGWCRKALADAVEARTGVRPHEWKPDVESVQRRRKTGAR